VITGVRNWLHEADHDLAVVMLVTGLLLLVTALTLAV
jgi:hypothetical protein